MASFLVLRSRLWHTSVRPARKGAEAMVKHKILAIMSATALAFSPVVAMADDSGIEQGSLARTGTGVAQVPNGGHQHHEHTCLVHEKDAPGCVLTPGEGGAIVGAAGAVVVCVVACGGGSGNGQGTTAPGS